MTRHVEARWLLRERMAEGDLWKTTELAPLLAERGVHLSATQIYRLVTQPPERLSLAVLVAVCGRARLHPERPHRVRGPRRQHVAGGRRDRPADVGRVARHDAAPPGTCRPQPDMTGAVEATALTATSSTFPSTGSALRCVAAADTPRQPRIDTCTGCGHRAVLQREPPTGSSCATCAWTRRRLPHVRPSRPAAVQRDDLRPIARTGRCCSTNSAAASHPTPSASPCSTSSRRVVAGGCVPGSPATTNSSP